MLKLKPLTEAKYFVGNYCKKGVDWHFYSLEKGFNSPESLSKKEIPAPLKEHYLSGYSKLVSIHSPTSKANSPIITICAIPENGGIYGIIQENASLDDVKLMKSESGLVCLLESKVLEEF